MNFDRIHGKYTVTVWIICLVTTAVCFHCENELVTIDDDKVCDGRNDCGDVSATDECDCNTTIKDVCLNGKCILEANQCNGIDDCEDGFASDETNCYFPLVNHESSKENLSDHTLLCNHEDAVFCADGRTCVMASRLCDGVYDCPDLSDETFAGPGMKCALKSPKVSMCILPQANVFDDLPHCVNHADLCFDSNGSLTDACFQCMDGKHIISKYQVCNGILDCMDFSDECLCHEIETPQVCSPGFVPTSPPSCKNRNSRIGHEIEWIYGSIECEDGSCVSTSLLCDGVYDCADGVDEKYCHKQKYFLSMQSIGNRSLPLQNRAYGMHQPTFFPNNSIRCHSTLHGWIMARTCDGYPACDMLEDECSPLCGETLPDFCRINTSCLSGHSVCNGYISSDRECPDGPVVEEEIGCPNRFYCEGGSRISIHQEQVCDGVKNCDDGSDESKDRDCRDDRFFCEVFDSNISTSENPMFVPKTLLFDGRSDCADSSDECPTNFNKDMFSKGNEMITSTLLKSLLWITAPIALLGNIYVFATTIHTIRKGSLPNAIATQHHVMIANLSAADGLMGVYLVLLCISSTVFSGSFCMYGKLWRISVLCRIMGTLVVISSQASVFILFLMGVFRFYTVYRPLESQFSSKTFRYCTVGLVFSWCIAISLGLLPWFLDYFITDFHYQSLFFNSDEVSREHFASFVQRVENMIKIDDLDPNLSFLFRNRSVITRNGSFVQKDFVSRRIPNMIQSGSFGFYSQNSICLPSYFTEPNRPGWEYSIFIVTMNFLFFLFMVAFYIFIAVLSDPKRHPALRSMSMSPAAVARLNFQKCKLHSRVARLLLTDFLCWIPLCILSYIHFSGVDLGDNTTAFCGIILLPINSALNPSLYSSFCDKLQAKLKALWPLPKFLRTRSYCSQRAAAQSNETSTRNQGPHESTQTSISIARIDVPPTV